MPLMFSTCQQTEYFLYVSVFSLPEPSLYRLRYYFWLFFWRPPPLSLALLHKGQESLALAWSSQPVLGSWDLGELPAVPQCAGSPLSLAPATFNSAFLLQARPRIQYRGALCWEQRHTPLGVYTHIHTFINHWKRQDQRRKEEQTPLRCWAWLRVALDTDGCTQDNCCLLFMEGPSATLRALFIWRLLKAPGQEPRGKSKLELCVSTVCVQNDHTYAVVFTRSAGTCTCCIWDYSSATSTSSMCCLFSEGLRKPCSSTVVLVTIKLLQQARVRFHSDLTSDAVLLYYVIDK